MTEMAQENKSQLDETQLDILKKISERDTDGFKQLIPQLKGTVNFVDDAGMTPLQHASFKGLKDVVQILLDMGADINFSEHGANYTPLHFAALSGSVEICRLLLDAGINPNSVNNVSRTASQMAAFVGNHACVDTINNYLPRSQIECFTKPQGETEPLVPPALLDAFHAFVTTSSLHPVRIALNLQSFGLLKNLDGLRKALESMCQTEIMKKNDINEMMAFKFHYFKWIVGELSRCEEQCKAQRKDKNTEEEAGKNDFVELFIKRVIKENKQGQLDYIEYTVRECVREFPFRECLVFKQAVTQLTAKDPPPALSVLRAVIHGQRNFMMNEVTECSTCGNEKPDKKCSKCKAVQYCDRECQRLHWFMHKKSCARPTSNPAAAPLAASTSRKDPIDTDELNKELSKLTAN